MNRAQMAFVGGSVAVLGLAMMPPMAFLMAIMVAFLIGSLAQRPPL